LTSSITRRLAAVGATLAATAAMTVAAAAPASAATGPGTTPRGNGSTPTVTENHLRYTASYARHRWVRVGEFETRRACLRTGERGEDRNLWSDYRCIRDWDRDWGRGDWDRRGRDWRGGRDGWNRRHRGDTDYVLYVRRSWGDRDWDGDFDRDRDGRGRSLIRVGIG